MIDFTSRQLRAFLLVAQYRSFSRAAAALFITPSGLSLLIRELETQLGVRLFDRTTRQVALTNSGTELRKQRFVFIRCPSLLDGERTSTSHQRIPIPKSQIPIASFRW